jgi:hypothetical protein
MVGVAVLRGYMSILIPPLGSSLYRVQDLKVRSHIRSSPLFESAFFHQGATFKSCPSGPEACDGRRQIFSIRPVKLQGHLPRLKGNGCLRRQDQYPDLAKSWSKSERDLEAELSKVNFVSYKALTLKFKVSFL